MRKRSIVELQTAYRLSERETSGQRINRVDAQWIYNIISISEMSQLFWAVSGRPTEAIDRRNCYARQPH